ncbi:uncharacterized protein [Battus philenor]|uniref:uncharacterized protein n=1 Tax=Battus philenor TaxID=42288 RepID=UPI0035CFC6E8
MKLWVTLCIVAAFTVIISAVERSSLTPRLVGANDYFAKIIQEMILELEEYGWSNLKMVDNSQTLNEHLYRWHVTGTVNYTNGFVVSIEKIDLRDIKNNMMSLPVNGTEEWHGSVHGDLMLWDLKAGFEVIVNLDNQPEQRFTGVFTYEHVTIRCIISKNMNTNEYTVTAQWIDFKPWPLSRMIYLPSSHVTQALSRRFSAHNYSPSATVWCRDIIQPILEKLVEKTEFPKACFAC